MWCWMHAMLSRWCVPSCHWFLLFHENPTHAYVHVYLESGMNVYVHASLGGELPFYGVLHPHFLFFLGAHCAGARFNRGLYHSADQNSTQGGQ